jgi:hypothetical protein
MICLRMNVSAVQDAWCHNDAAWVRIREPAFRRVDPLNTYEDFRFNAHKRLLEVDASTSLLMMLVVSGEVSGGGWDEAWTRQKLAYDAWTTLVCGVQIDSMTALDCSPCDLSNPNA